MSLLNMVGKWLSGNESIPLTRDDVHLIVEALSDARSMPCYVHAQEHIDYLLDQLTEYLP